MSFLQQAQEFLRFELRQQWRQTPFVLALVTSIGVGVALAASDLGRPDVAVGRLDRNVPYAVLHGAAVLSAVGMFVVLVTVAPAALRDVRSRMAELVFSRPVRPSAYLLGRFLAGVSSALLCLTAGLLAMAVTQLVLHGQDPEVGPVPWYAFAHAWGLILLPNVLLVAALLFLAALVTRSMGATFLALLPIIIGQDIAEALPVGAFGHRLPALLDPLGLAALHSVTRNWTLQQFERALPPVAGDLLLNRGVWMLVSVLAMGLAARAFGGWSRRTVGGGRRREREHRNSAGSSVVTSELVRAETSTGAPLHRAQFWSVARFECGRMASSLSFRVVLVTGLALVVYSMGRGDAILGVRLSPTAQTIAQAIRRASNLTTTLMVVLFAGEQVWRERTTRMALTLDGYPVPSRVMAAGKMAAFGVLLFGTVSLYGVVAWVMQGWQAEALAPALPVLATVLHEGLQVMQLAAAAFFLQAIVGGRMTGYLAMGAFLMLRLGVRVLGYESDLYTYAGMRMPFFSEMNGYGHGLARWGVVHLYWSLIAFGLASASALFWPRGIELSVSERWAEARRRLSRRGGLVLAGATFAVLACGAVLYLQTERPGRAFDRQAVESLFLDYEEQLGDWKGRLRPEVVDIQADLDIDAARRRLRIRGRYLLRNPHAQAIGSVLVNHDPDLHLRGLVLGASGVDSDRAASVSAMTLSTVSGSSPLPGTRIVRFDPPLAPGAEARLDFDLEFDPAGWGNRPADRWILQNGLFLLCGTGTHPFFRGAQGLPTLGYDTAREIRRTRARERRGLGPWAALPSPEAYLEAHPEGSRAAVPGAPRGEGVGGSDQAAVELWIHADADMQAVAPGVLLERSVEGGRAHYHYRSDTRIQAFFPVMCGRYEKRLATQGDVQLELFFHPAHAARVDHIAWAMQRSLACFEERWGAYPHDALRLVEVPGQEGLAFAASFPGGVMGFAESMGFRCPHGDGCAIDFRARGAGEDSPANVDPVLWVVAHEIAHQWWDSHVIAAEALGAGFTSETLAQYGSLCVVQAEYGDEVVRRMAAYNRQVYLEGRRQADRKELPLVLVDEQDHLHYGKGFVAFHALTRQAGFAPIDRALAGIVDAYAGAEGSPVTSRTIVDALRDELPTEMAPRLREWLEEVAFVDGSVRSATTKRTEEGEYDLQVECRARGLLADGNGEEVVRDFTGELELEVWQEGVERPELLRARARDGILHYAGTFARQPIRVVLDPRLLHMDRDLSDNRRSVLEVTR